MEGGSFVLKLVYSVSAFTELQQALWTRAYYQQGNQSELCAVTCATARISASR